MSGGARSENGGNGIGPGTDDIERRSGGKVIGADAGDGGHRAGDVEIRVSESDIKDLKILDRSDLVFAVLYGVLFVWGLVLTLLAI